jgi:hypothetical protein
MFVARDRKPLIAGRVAQAVDSDIRYEVALRRYTGHSTFDGSGHGESP